ncbi:lytic murein transglycosylase [Parvularcula maris]|uniref:Lytic murein transglycosylase n=1 Tax=Parvularcula maris TaxID=2965077 RepID=A0A9X2L8B9_9PROT|nr:lytic murein transglycosylase [Parvularcula maris]MCQ8184969.1 lytic murein transglycosylase [Parvularcula maris]
MLLAPLAAVYSLSSAAALDAEVERFRNAFRAEAIASGVSASVYDREMATAQRKPKVLERDANQPEFVRPIWDYLDSATSDRRVAEGRESFAAQETELRMIASSYGVSPYIIAAIWGLESNYGSILGRNDIISALTTLGMEGRRQRFGRTELIGALKIIQNGYATRGELQGSWAGAMGQTQFIPTTYLAYAIDFDGDGRRDLWKDTGDVFASTANYLDRAGWKTGERWGVEVNLPEGFDYALADGRRYKVTDWIRLGVRGSSVALPDAIGLDTGAKLLIPAGANGPAFLTFKNFDVIKRYNNATSYALGVALLSERIAGSERNLVNEWPRGDVPLTRTQNQELQQALTNKGYDTGGVDGVVGPNTRRALRSWQRDNGMAPDGYPSSAVLEKLTGEA